MDSFKPLIALAALAAAPLWSAEAERRLALPAGPGAVLRIETGAGFLKVEGRPGQKDIQVHARCRVDGTEQDLLDRVQLSLEATDKGPRLVARLDNLRGPRGWFRFGTRNEGLDVTVTVPQGVGLSVVDGSGDIDVQHLQGPVDIQDGSGSLRVSDITGRVRIQDGSGEIQVSRITGTLEVIDGSGDMTLAQITGEVTVTDGSGDIDVADVKGVLNLKATGSGAVRTRNITQVRQGS